MNPEISNAAKLRHLLSCCQDFTPVVFWHLLFFFIFCFISGPSNEYHCACVCPSKALRSKKPRGPDRRSTRRWKPPDRCAQTFGESQLDYFFSTTEAFSALVVFLPQGFFSSPRHVRAAALKSSSSIVLHNDKKKKKKNTRHQSPVQKRKLLTENCGLTSKHFGLWTISLCGPRGHT